MQLEQLRKEWERGLKLLATIDQTDSHGRILAILQKKENYHLHRYCQIGNTWDISADKQNCTLDEVWIWLNNPGFHSPLDN